MLNIIYRKMNFGYLFKDEKNIGDLIGGKSVSKSRVYFEIMRQNKKLINSVVFIFGSDSIQRKKIESKLDEIIDTKDISDDYFDKLILIENISNRFFNDQRSFVQGEGIKLRYFRIDFLSRVNVF